MDLFIEISGKERTLDHATIMDCWRGRSTHLITFSPQGTDKGKAKF